LSNGFAVAANKVTLTIHPFLGANDQPSTPATRARSQGSAGHRLLDPWWTRLRVENGHGPRATSYRTMPLHIRTSTTNSTKIRFERNTVRSTLERPRSRGFHACNGGRPIGQTKVGIRPTPGTLGDGGSFFPSRDERLDEQHGQKTRPRAGWVDVLDVVLGLEGSPTQLCATFSPRRLFTRPPPAAAAFDWRRNPPLLAYAPVEAVRTAAERVLRPPSC
jgi:hypothetical protein